MEILDKEKLEKFKEVLSSLKEQVAIISSHADPDSLACSQVMKAILHKHGKVPHTFFQSHTNDPNIAMWSNSFKSAKDLFLLENCQDNLDDFSVIFIDFNNVKNLEPHNELIPDIILDHHELSFNKESVAWSWVDNYGSATSMALNIFFELGMKLEDFEDLATQGAVGISVDVGNDFLSTEAKDLDVEMFSKARKYSDKQEVRSLAFVFYDKKLFRFLKIALDNASDRGDVLVTHLGLIEDEEDVRMAIIADSIYKFRAFETVVVWAILKKSKSIIHKSRSSARRVALNDFIKEKFGEAGGARTGKGAGIFPALPPVYDPLNKEALEKFVAFFQEQVFAIVSQTASE